MNKIIILYCLCIVSLQVSFAQVKKFEVPAENGGYLTLKLNKNDSLRVLEDSAFVMSSNSFYGYQTLINQLYQYQTAFTKIDTLNASFDTYLKALADIQKILETTQNIEKERINEIIKNLTDVNQKINSDVDKLKELNELIRQKTEELNDIKKKLNWHKFKNLFFKFGDWIVAGAIGVAIGSAL